MLYRWITLCGVVVSVLCSGVSMGAPDTNKSEDLASYNPLVGSQRRQVVTQPNSTETYEYVDPEGQVVGKELVDVKSKNVVERALFRNGKRHGMQRRWDREGTLIEEIPYRDGVLDGWVMRWDTEGRLIGRSLVENGNGVVRNYFSNGRLNEEKPYKNNGLEGMAVDLLSNGQVLSLAWWKDGHLSGEGFTFHESGKLRGWGRADDQGRTHGVVVELDASGKGFQFKAFSVHGQQVDEAEYAKLAASDPSLTPFVNDPAFYQKKLTQEVSDIVAKYRQLPVVTIPLRVEGAQTRPSPQ